MSFFGSSIKEQWDAQVRENELKTKYEGDNPYIRQYLEFKKALKWDKYNTNRKATIKEDFQAYYDPMDDIFSGASGDEDPTRPSLASLERLTDKRIGVCQAMTRQPADDVMRNWITWKNYDGKDVKNETTREILKWQLKADFYNKYADGLYCNNWAGIAFLMKYWSKKKDKAFIDGKMVKGNKQPDYSKPPPTKTKPVKLNAFDPLRLVPSNLAESQTLDYDEEVWDFSGGLLGGAGQIHRDRIHVIKTRKLGDQWRGLSILEPAYLSLIVYFNSIIFVMKDLSKLGQVIAAWEIDKEHPTKEEYAIYLDIYNDFRANYGWILGKGQKLTFHNTKIGSGMTEYMEFIKEDISSCCGIPVPYLFGRVVSAGLSGMGFLAQERKYMNTIAKMQHRNDDDMIKFHSKIGFEIEDLRPNWNLTLQKTIEQELQEEAMRMQNEIMKEKLKQEKQITKNMKLQFDVMQKFGLPEKMDEISELKASEGAEGKTPALEYKKEEKEKEDFVRPTIVFNNYFPKKIDEDFINTYPFNYFNKNRGKKID